jgi:molybdopterin converting factor small subunit
MSRGGVRVILFASAREAVGHPVLERPVPVEGVGVPSFLGQLVRDFPRLKSVLAVSRLVQNGQYLRGQRGRLRPGDELAIHPPYSGG